MNDNSAIYTIHHADARDICNILSDDVIDVTITSPPYFDVKDYGSTNQIGFGQEYNEYIKELKNVFSQIYKYTKDTGTLWVIIDTINKNGEVISIPFDFASEIRKVGWKFREIIIWEKDKTVPWTHKGQMRNSFEYILMFSKGDNYNFYIDRIRDYESLKKWWVKYPERYNPRGKAPESVWHFPIPVQGSWGDGYIRHFCPLPEDLIARILTLTTDEGDVVFDPFSGSGAVLAKAQNMGRKYIGTELNHEYIAMFKDYIAKTSTQKEAEYKQAKKFLKNQKNFERIIIELRALKYGRILYQKVSDFFCEKIKKIRIELEHETPKKKNSIAVASYTFLISDLESDLQSKIKDFIKPIVERPPLSKFGIDSKIFFESDLKNFIRNDDKVFVYSCKNTHRFIRSVCACDFLGLKMSESLLSSIHVDINENDYE